MRLWSDFLTREGGLQQFSPIIGVPELYLGQIPSRLRLHEGGGLRISVLVYTDGHNAEA